LLHEKLGLTQEERHRVMRAASQAVEQDGRLQHWGRRLIEIQESLQRIHEQMVGSKPASDEERDRAAEAGGG
jgi:hypothetical protein